MVELGEHVKWKVPGLTQQEFEGLWRSRTWLGEAERSDENLMADVDREHIARSIGRRLVQHRWCSKNVK